MSEIESIVVSYTTINVGSFWRNRTNGKLLKISKIKEPNVGMFIVETMGEDGITQTFSAPIFERIHEQMKVAEISTMPEIG